MVNVLLEGYDFKSRWIYRELKNYLHPDMRVLVLPLSFRDSEIYDSASWHVYYGAGGKHRNGISESFKAYGIKQDNINFINYFSDTQKTVSELIRTADILFFTGGLPKRMTERIDELGIRLEIEAFDGIVMGNSAGALVQLGEYHVTPDRDYPEFRYMRGLSYINDFYLEVHYTASEEQKRSIARVISERKKTVYATSPMAGALICENGNVHLIGDVKTFSV